MKKFGVSSPIELSPDDTKKFFNYVDKNWEAEEESDGSKNEILPALVGLGAAGLAGAGMAAGGIAKGIGSAVGGVARGVGSLAGDDETEDTNEIAPALAAGLGAVGGGIADKVMDRVGFGDKDEDVTTGKVGKKDKGSYQHAYKLALKKYKIHNADELDTPEERKGFTDYVDRLWKKGDIHRDKKEASIDTDEVTSAEKAQRKVDIAREKKKRGQAAAQKTPAEKQKERDVAKKAADRERNQKEIERKAEQNKQRRDREAQQPDDTADPDDKKDPDKKNGTTGKSKGGFLSKISTAAQKHATKYQTAASKEAAVPEGVKKTPGVSKKARGAVGRAKHARKGTGAKRRFQKGVRQAGKKQSRNEARPTLNTGGMTGAERKMGQGIADKLMKTMGMESSNEVLYQPPKSNKKTPETSWDKASEDKRAKLLQLASPRTSTKYTKLDYRELTPMLQKAIDKVYKTKKAKLEVSPPDRKHQVKGIKKHLGQKGKKGIPKTYVDKKTGKRKETNPWALAWGQYDKYGVPSRDEKD